MQGPVGTLPVQTASEPSALALDDEFSHLASEREPCVVVAGKLQTCKHPRPSRLFRHSLKCRSLVRQEIGQDRRCRLRRCRVLGRIRRTGGDGKFRGQPTIELARTAAVVEVLGLPRCNRCIVHRHRHVRVHAGCVGRRRHVGNYSCIDHLDPPIGWCACVPILDLLLDFCVVATEQPSEGPELGARFTGSGRRRNAKRLARWNHPSSPVARVGLDPTVSVSAHCGRRYEADGKHHKQQQLTVSLVHVRLLVSRGEAALARIRAPGSMHANNDLTKPKERRRNRKKSDRSKG